LGNGDHETVTLDGQDHFDVNSHERRTVDCPMITDLLQPVDQFQEHGGCGFIQTFHFAPFLFTKPTTLAVALLTVAAVDGDNPWSIPSGSELAT